MKNDGFIIEIKDDDSKSDIIYNNVVNSMENMSMSKDEQIEYLKSRISELEKSQRRRFNFLILGLVSFFLLLIGITFIILNLYFVGSIFIFSTCFVSCFITYKMSNSSEKIDFSKFERVEKIRKFINSRIK